MSEYLPYGEYKFDKNGNLKDMLNTPIVSDIAYLVEVDLSYSDNIKKTKSFPFRLENKNISQNDFNKYMKKIEPKTYTPHKKLICDWTDKKIFDLL